MSLLAVRIDLAPVLAAGIWDNRETVRIHLPSVLAAGIGGRRREETGDEIPQSGENASLSMGGDGRPRPLRQDDGRGQQREPQDGGDQTTPHSLASHDRFLLSRQVEGAAWSGPLACPSDDLIV
jgi:hypothetical protein